MKTRPHDPLRLDVVAFAADGAELSGEWPAPGLPRFASGQTAPQDVPLAGVRWQARGERRKLAVGEPQVWLHLKATTTAWLTCQRCLQPFEQALVADRRFRFVADEAQAEALDAESEDDVLATPRWLDVRELAEDELLLALPLVPRHAVCPEPLPNAAEPAAEADEHPFSLLRQLKVERGNGPAEG
jgi:uncharacterized protein